MANTGLMKANEMPLYFDDFFKPWNDWFSGGVTPWNRMFSAPAVNIYENKENYIISLAVPGMKKDDFRIDIDGDVLTIFSEKEESKEEKEKKFTRKEYNFTSFRRSFTLPMEVMREKIEAKYEDGILRLTLPFNVEIKKPLAKHIAVK